MEQLPGDNLLKNPLVSIIVITYNSAKYIVETLESIKAQTYRNIELIISDDCSNDDTIKICKKWIAENKGRFVKTELITSLVNTGIPANCNRGMIPAKGEWVKFIAGDDILIASAVNEVIRFIEENDKVEILDSKVDIYNEDLSLKIGNYDFQNNCFHDNEITAQEQLAIFIKRLDGRRIITTLGVFAKRKLIDNLGGFDIRYKLLEDAPMWYKVLKSNIKFYFLNKVTVLYRTHKNSISNPDRIEKKGKLISDFKLTVDQFIWDNIYRSSDLLSKLNMKWLRFFTKLVLRCGNKGYFAALFLKIGRFTQPIRLLWFKRTFIKLLE
jgi:glycosyltransferase involved in cell wall biosynthesis